MDKQSKRVRQIEAEIAGLDRKILERQHVIAELNGTRKQLREELTDLQSRIDEVQDAISESLSIQSDTFKIRSVAMEKLLRIKEGLDDILD